MNTNAIATHTVQSASINLAQLQERAKALRLMGLLAHWESLQGDPVRLGWTKDLLDWEESERAQRSLERLDVFDRSPDSSSRAFAVLRRAG